MRTNVVIDDDLMKQAMRASGAKTQRAAVEAALRLMVGVKQQEKMRKLRGKVPWRGDLRAMRRDRLANNDPRRFISLDRLLQR